jgi:hypothetical protein
VFRVLMDRAGVVKIIAVVSMLWGLGSRFDLDLVLHVSRCCMSCIPQARRHVR